MRGIWLATLLVVGCAGDGGTDATDAATDGSGACGAQSTHSVTLRGEVEDAAGNPVADADLVVEETLWTPGTVYGTGTSGADGTFEITLPELLSIENCWGTALDYTLKGSTDTLAGEKWVNVDLFNAVDDESYQADITGRPLVLE